MVIELDDELADDWVHEAGNALQILQARMETWKFEAEDLDELQESFDSISELQDDEAYSQFMDEFGGYYDSVEEVSEALESLQDFFGHVELLNQALRKEAEGEYQKFLYEEDLEKIKQHLYQYPDEIGDNVSLLAIATRGLEKAHQDEEETGRRIRLDELLEPMNRMGKVNYNSYGEDWVGGGEDLQIGISTLMMNKAKYAGDAEVGALVDQDHSGDFDYEVLIWDTGEGMDPDDNGSGKGFDIVNRFTRKYGGEFEVLYNQGETAELYREKAGKLSGFFDNLETADFGCIFSWRLESA